MTREEAKKYLPIIQAYIDGKQVQWLDETGKWHDVNDELLTFYSPPSNYRIKPESKYRPFKSQEECWNEMLKHHPFGWIRNNDTQRLYNIRSIDCNNYGVVIDNFILYFDYAFNVYNFVDGSPFGIKEK